MTSRERVLAAFAHTEPDRVPMWYGAAEGLTERLIRHTGAASEEDLMARLNIDFRRVHQEYIGPAISERGDGRFVTFWGVERGGMEYGQALTHPLAGAETVAEVLDFDWPNPAWFTARNCRAQCEAWRDFAIIGGPWVVIWSDATELIGMEEYLVKMVTHPEVIRALNDRVADFYWARAVEFFETCGDCIDIFFFGDDFGTQEALFVSPDMWRVFFKPLLKRFSDLGHDFGMKTMFHSCGSVWSIIPDLVEIGIDALNPVQVLAKGMDPVALKDRWGGSIVFHGAIDHQRLLPFGTPEEVRAEVRRIVDIMAPGGGYCLAPSHDLMLSDFPPENIVAMYDEGFVYLPGGG